MLNTHRAILTASFLTLIAAGMGFAIRTKVLADWGALFGFTKTDLGQITGGGFVGFGVVILISSLFIDRVGYKPVLVIAFLLHVLSAVVTVAATPVFDAFGKGATYQCLYWGMFLFAVANGLCEAVINPLVADLSPGQKTHYLNILHAGWPGGMIVGGVLAYFFAGPGARAVHLRWEIPITLFLIPTLIYGFVIVKEKFPVSEARAAGVTFGTMLWEFTSPVLLLLLLLHAMVGYVELGTDSWITNIMENVIAGKAILLFVYMSGLMFVLRFFAGPIVEKINPLGLLFASSILGCIGLIWLGYSTAGLGIFLAATTYGVGKTFLWPTMLAVVGERFPKGGALTMGAVGGMGALSAGLLGTPGIGYQQDYYAAQNLQERSPSTYERYISEDKKSFLFFPSIAGLDARKVATLDDKGADLHKSVKALQDEGEDLGDDKKLAKLFVWWQTAKEYQEPDKEPVEDAGIFGGRMALRWTALVPFSMAIGYLILILYFRSKGGYTVEALVNDAQRPPAEGNEGS